MRKLVREKWMWPLRASVESLTLTLWMANRLFLNSLDFSFEKFSDHFSGSVRKTRKKGRGQIKPKFSVPLNRAQQWGNCSKQAVYQRIWVFAVMSWPLTVNWPPAGWCYWQSAWSQEKTWFIKDVWETTALPTILERHSDVSDWLPWKRSPVNLSCWWISTLHKQELKIINDRIETSVGRVTIIRYEWRESQRIMGCVVQSLPVLRPVPAFPLSLQVADWLRSMIKNIDYWFSDWLCEQAITAELYWTNSYFMMTSLPVQVFLIYFL